MKKLVFGICLILSTFSCDQTTDHSKADEKDDSTKRILPPPPDKKTLNGIPTPEAGGMIDNFQHHAGTYDQSNRTNVWFSKKAFFQIYGQLGAADGVRVYFAKKSANPTDIKNNTIVLVSTVDGGQYPGGPIGKRVHKDFFQEIVYASSDELRGQIHCTDPGAILWQENPVLPVNDNCDNSKDHYLSSEKAFIMVSNYGKDQINTTSEWFKKDLFDALNTLLTKDPSLDGVRVYFARKLHPNPDPKLTTDIFNHGFVFITTTGDGIHEPHVDHFQCITLKKSKDKGGYDNGEECPTNCQGTGLP